MERLTVKRKDGRWALSNADKVSPFEQFEKIALAIDRLAAYEDTGLEPEMLKELAQAEKDGRLVVFPTEQSMLGFCHMRVETNGNCSPMGGFCKPDTEICKALHAAYDYGTFNARAELRSSLKDERLEVPPPNAPLTLDELREMDGEPVWVVGISAINDWKGHWDIFEWSDGKMLFCKSLEEPELNNYDPTGRLGIAGWTAYRRRPEEV